MLQLLEQDQPTPSQRDLIRTARESAHHLLALLNDVLDVSALESGKIALHEEPLNMRRLCQEVQNLMRSEAAARGLTLTAHVDPGMPARVRGDATRIKQILLNLLNNAIKFTPSGQVVMEASCTRPNDSMADLRFSVTDTGIGMDEATLSRLFQRFEMGDVTLSRRFGGAGLGLEISRTLARMMGGELTATSQPGKGSRFELTLRLPVVRAAQATDQDSMFGAISTAPGLYVLVADDHPVNRKYLGLVLESMGHEVMLCENGQQALDAVRSGAPFDMVLMDVHMPVMDGLSATRAIRELGGRYASLPVLVLTADVMGTTRQRAQESGVTAFLTKPIQTDQLSQALDRAAARYASSQHPGPPDAGVSEPAALGSFFDELGTQLPEGQLGRLVAMFFADDSRTIADLDEALASGNKARIREAAHKLDGSVSLFGFKRIAGVLESISALPVQGPTPEHEAARLRLRQAIEETRLAATEAQHAAESVRAQSYVKV
jgi:CheY-like chemotaxis protein/HPt (histidine-containing phosphotransfer) domain-containing protein